MAHPAEGTASASGLSDRAGAKGVKKPFNPVLGEYFRCKWDCEDGSASYYVAEQTCHHPPVSAFFMANPANNLIVTGNFKPKSWFLGNSVQSQMDGKTFISFTNRPGERYVASNPNIYARGLVFGTMLMELGDSVQIECELTDLVARINFRVKVRPRMAAGFTRAVGLFYRSLQ